MGDFSVSCGMSGLSLINTEVVLFPLIPNPYEGKGGKFEFSQHSIVSNEGATALFEPWALPIFGELGSYGSLDSIEEDYNTRALETKFDMSIEEIAEEMCYPSGDKKFPQFHTSMLVHREVWDKFSRPGLDDYGKIIELTDYKGTPRRETWDKTIADWKRSQASNQESLAHFKQEFYKGRVGYDTVKLFSRVSYFDLQYILSFGARRNVEALLDIYPDAMDSQEFYDRMEQLHCFRWNMMACNRLFMPTYNGYQYGNFYMVRELANLTAKIAQESINESESDDDDFDDSDEVIETVPEPQPNAFVRFFQRLLAALRGK